MSQQTFVSTVSQVIDSGRDTARHVVGFAQGRAARAVASVDERWSHVVEAGGNRLSPKLRSDLVAAEKEISGVYAWGVERAAGVAYAVIDAVAAVSVNRLEGFATNASKLGQLVDGRTVDSLAVVAMPAAQAASDVATRLAAGAANLAERVSAAPKAFSETAIKRAPARKSRRRSS